MNNLLTYTAFLSLFAHDAEKLGVSYGELEKVLRLSRRTLYNERSVYQWKVKFCAGSGDMFEPQSVYEWYVDYTVQRQRKQAA